MKSTPDRTRMLSRRQFAQRAAQAGAAALTFPQILRSSAFGAAATPAPSNRISVGVIGTGNQGTNDMRALLADERVQVVAVCDVNRESAGYWDGGVAGRDPAKNIVEGYYTQKDPAGTYKGCDALIDFRELIARKDIDAVLIATPDHWHAILAIEAAKAKKDVYCQKPLSLTIVEGRAMSDAMKKYRRVFQCGSQQRSDGRFRQACEIVRNGRIGKLQTVKCGLPGGHSDYGKTGNRKSPEPVPEGFDYEMWLGPAPAAPYAPARCHVNFRWNLDYSGGQLTDWGGHHPDIAQWGMDTQLTGPVLVRNAKGTFPARTELWNTATDYYFECVYENGVVMSISSKNRMGVTFEGSEGWVYVNRGAIEASNDALLAPDSKRAEVQLYSSSNHFRNFIDCVISRKETIAPCEVAHRSITLSHLGNIAMQLGRDLRWDPVRERVIGDHQANSMLSRPYRDPWKLPELT